MGYHRTGALFAIGRFEYETSEYAFRKSMTQSEEDIQINEYMNLNVQLNTTTKPLIEVIAQKDQAIADMQKQLDKMMEELKSLQRELLGR
ncbi:MAG: hypothetical protein UEB92_08635 [Clostridia bacterium]|nr:hypothetical protein [Clostridia bacterium]